MPPIVQHSRLIGIEALVEAWANAWNDHDAEAAAALIMPEVDFINVFGRWLKGKKEFIDHHRQLHAMQMRNSTWSNLDYEARFIGDDLAILHLEWMVQGDEDPDGTPRRTRCGVFTWILIRTESSWRILAAHNTNLHPSVSHRLRSTGRDTRGG